MRRLLILQWVAVGLLVCAAAAAALSVVAPLAGYYHQLVGVAVSGTVGVWLAFAVLYNAGSIGDLSIAHTRASNRAEVSSRRSFAPVLIAIALMIFLVGMAALGIGELAQGSTQEDGGRFYINSHGSRIQIGASEYGRAVSAEIRIALAVLSLFLTVVVAASFLRMDSDGDSLADPL